MFGDNCKPTQLFEDNSYTLDFQKGQYAWSIIEWDGVKGKITKKSNYKGINYRIVNWTQH